MIWHPHHRPFPRFRSGHLRSRHRALEINPDYQPARSNREVVEQMEYGSPLANTTYQSIKYALENFRRERQ